MKFFVSAFFFILGALSVVHSLQCHLFDNPKALMDCTIKFGMNPPGDTEDEMSSNMVACVRGKITQEHSNCNPGITECVTVTLEYKDQTEIMIKACETPDHQVCEAVKASPKYQVDDRFIKNSHCDYCSSDNCNDKTPKDKPILPKPSSTDSSSPEPSSPEPTPADEPSEKEKKQKHSASYTAVSSPPVSAVFITILIIHILL